MFYYCLGKSILPSISSFGKSRDTGEVDAQCAVETINKGYNLKVSDVKPRETAPPMWTKNTFNPHANIQLAEVMIPD